MVFAAANGSGAMSLADNTATPVSCLSNPVVSMPIPTPSVPGAYSYSPGNYDYITSADGKIAVHADRTYEVGENKFGFNKPAGATSIVIGRRIDGEATPMGVDQFPPESYPYNFEVMGLVFPMSGFWEITIKAGSSELEFFAVVIGRDDDEIPACGSFAELVASSDTIFVGTVRQRTEFSGGAWVSFDVSRVLGYRVGGLDTALNVADSGNGIYVPFTGYFLLEPATLSTKLQTSSTYVVFAFGYPAEIACPADSLAIVQKDGQTLQFPDGAAPLYAATTIDVLSAAVGSET
jgi:hypothetical protein